MNVCISNNEEGVSKKRFELKPVKKDGLVIQIHHTIKSTGTDKRIRFLYTAFDASGLVVASADFNGNIFIVDLSCNKFWSLPKFDSCSVLAFNPQQTSEIIFGTKSGSLYALNIHSGIVRSHLQDHNYPVKSISFANEHCLSASLTQAVIFNLKTFTKIHELTVESPATLKQIFFMPVTHHIIACFSDDYIHVWKSGTFESFKKLLPADWNKFFLKTMAVTRNGSTMILAGVSHKIIVFSLDVWAVTKILTLSEDITIKYADFISQSHDGGANKYLVLLANNGVVHILNMEENIVVHKIILHTQITSFQTSTNGIHLACVLKSGEVNVYKLSNFIGHPPEESECDPACFKYKRKMKYSLPCSCKQPKEELNLDKLRLILRQSKEYPASYRVLIWEKLLCLPKNSKAFAGIINKGYDKTFDKLDEKYPLINKRMLKNLKRLLSNLSNWCPIFAEIDFLPLFVFPFTKIFHNDPLTCFEAVITIITNWCQHWFQYAPCAPINILAMIENVLVEHDPNLLTYLAEKNIPSQIYAWLMLETVFSEILVAKDWCILWDHILSNEPSFILMVPVAYNIIFRETLAYLATEKDFENFYHHPNPISIQKLINKSYFLLKNTSEANHPKKYLKDFTKLTKGSYPLFQDLPKIKVVKGNVAEQTANRRFDDEYDKIEAETKKYREIEAERQRNLEMQAEENRRLQMMEDMLQEKLLQEKQRKHQRQIDLSKMKTELMDMQAESMETSRRKMEEMNLGVRKRELNKMMKNVEYSQMQDDIDIQQTEEELSRHYVELLKQKTILENLLLESAGDKTVSAERNRNIERQREKLKNELNEIRNNVNFRRISHKIDVPYGISLAKDKTQNVDTALAKEMAAMKMHTSASHANMQILKMKNDTTELEHDVQNLLKKFTDAKMSETNVLLHRLTNDMCECEQMIEEDRQLLQHMCHRRSCPSSSRRQKTNNYCPNISSRL